MCRRQRVCVVVGSITAGGEEGAREGLLLLGEEEQLTQIPSALSSSQQPASRAKFAFLHERILEDQRGSVNSSSWRDHPAMAMAPKALAQQPFAVVL